MPQSTPKHPAILAPPLPARGSPVQTIYVLLLLVAIGTSGLLRSFHHQTAHLFGGPFGSLLGIAFFAFLAMHLVQRRQDRDLFPHLERRRGLRPALTLPLLVVLLGEKWMSVELLESAYNWIDLAFRDPAMADAIYRLWTGMTLLGTALILLWVLRQCRHRITRLVTFERMKRALVLVPIALAGMGLLLLGLKALASQGQWSLAELPGKVFLAAWASQLVRAASEELFYRGLLQTSLIRLFTEAGMGEGRLPRLLAIGGISVGFSLEHYNPASSPAENLGPLLFVFTMSCALGALLEVSRNLYLVIAAHAVLNLCLFGLLPLPISGSGVLLLKPALVGAIFMLFIYTSVALRHRS